MLPLYQWPGRGIMYIVSVLGQDEGYMVNYSLLPEGTP